MDLHIDGHDLLPRPRVFEFQKFEDTYPYTLHCDFATFWMRCEIHFAIESCMSLCANDKDKIEEKLRERYTRGEERGERS